MFPDFDNNPLGYWGTTPRGYAINRYKYIGFREISSGISLRYTIRNDHK